MTSRENSLLQFFGSDRVQDLKSGLAQYMKSDDYAELKKEVTGQLSTIKWPGAVDKIAAQVDTLLDSPLSDTLTKVYSESNVLAKYTDPEHYDPDEVVLVELTEHAIDSTHAPHLDIVINGQRIGQLTLDVALQLELKGLILKIQNARIMEINPGTCTGSGTVSFYGQTLVKKESEPVSLLGPIDLGEGIPIAPLIGPEHDAGKSNG